MILIDMELPVGCEVCPLCDFDKHSDKCYARLRDMMLRNRQREKCLGIVPHIAL